MSIILKSGTSSTLANVTTGGALQVDGSAVTQPVSISGTVPVSASTALPVSISGTVPVSVAATLPVSIAATVPVSIASTVIVDSLNATSANAPSAQSVSTSSGQILASNSSRKQFLVVNTGVNAVYLGLGQTPTATAYHVALSPCLTANDGTGGTFLSNLWTGAINAIAAAASTVTVMELS